MNICRQKLRHFTILMLTIFIVWQWSSAGLIASKAYLAQWLIAQSWETTLITGNSTKPWPWADTWPVAKITFNKGTHYYVLAGDSGNSLAFGPGHSSNTALPGTQGTSVVSAHRDTHFSLLEHSKVNDRVFVQNKYGKESLYTIKDLTIVNTKKQDFIINQYEENLYLITCYPFNAISTGGDLRLIIKASKS